MLRVLLALSAVMPAIAGRIEITGESMFSLRTGSELEITISTGGQAGRVGFQLLGPSPGGARMAVLDGSTLPYYPDFLFDIRLESADGNRSLSARRSLVTPGTLHISGSQRDVAVLEGFLEIPEDFLDEDGLGILRISKLGPDMEFGLGEGYTMRNAITIPGIRTGGAGRAGRVLGVREVGPDTRGATRAADAVSETPEPATALLAGAAIAALGFVKTRLRRRRPQRKG